MNCNFLKPTTPAHSGESRNPVFGLSGTRLSPGWVNVLAMIGLFLVTLAPANAQQREGGYLYLVTTVRAAPGKLEELINWFSEMKSEGYYDDAGGYPPFVMRHSQGDQWDLLMISPMESMMAYYSKASSERRSSANRKHSSLITKPIPYLAFSEDIYALGPPLEVISDAYEENDFYHIEMFHSAPGMLNELIGQRRMENTYLDATGQTTNMIFRRAAGSDVDVFTIGFHKNLVAFAAPAFATDEDKEQAAKDAGFKGRSDISFYLRSLISAHHDTLAVKVE